MAVIAGESSRVLGGKAFEGMELCQFFANGSFALASKVETFLEAELFLSSRLSIERKLSAV